MDKPMGIFVAGLCVWFIGLVLIETFTHDVPLLYLYAPIAVPLFLTGAVNVVGWVINQLDHR